MSQVTLIGLSMIGLLVTCACGIGAKILRDFSRSELKDYCRYRRHNVLFGKILDHHQRLALAANTLKMIGISVLLIFGSRWIIEIPPLSEISPIIAMLVPLATGALLLMIAAVWIPEAVARIWAAPLLFHTWSWWWAIGFLVWPFTVGLGFVDSLLCRLAGRSEQHEDEEEAFEDEIRTMVTAGEHDGLLEADAREMIEGVMELGDADVADIMTPRSEIDAIEGSFSWPEVIKFVIQAGRTRIPVYDKVLDNVVGILFVKDLLPELSKSPSESRLPLKDLLRQPWYVPKTKAVDDMLQEFLHTRSHLAIVLDEYRSVAGVITIEDVLEEIVGEIEDESDKNVSDEIEMLDESTADVLGKSRLADINERLSLDLPEPEEFDTIAGFVINHLGHIPQVGESFTVGPVRITVRKASRRRVELVRLERHKNIQKETA